MAEDQKPIKLTVQIHNRALYRAVRHLAVEQEKSLREIVVEALQAWVQRQEEMEDLAAIHETEGEESYPWDQVKIDLRTRQQDERVA